MSFGVITLGAAMRERVLNIVNPSDRETKKNTGVGATSPLHAGGAGRRDLMERDAYRHSCTGG